LTSVVPLTTTPFRHTVIDGWWDDAILRDTLAEFPDGPESLRHWQRFENSSERKYAGGPQLWGPRTQELFKLIESRTGEIEELFGIAGLHMETIGGGYHLIEPGGYLAVHTDFNRSSQTGRYRRLNLLIYLNEDWQDPGGHLELWDAERCIADIAPEFNRTVIFETSDHSWHGHPVPAERWRKSVAAYFFTDEPPEGYHGEHSTVWHA
jgi:2OG-Fe(II) oxygenase superfamily